MTLSTAFANRLLPVFSRLIPGLLCFPAHGTGHISRAWNWSCFPAHGTGHVFPRLAAVVVFQRLIPVAMGPLQLAVTWYKIHHAGEQTTHWDIHNKENANLS